MASVTDIANMALSRIGSLRINDYATDANIQAIHFKLHYEPTRDALLRSYWWRFANARAQLAQNVTAPIFEWTYSYALPDDFICLRSVFEDSLYHTHLADDAYELEGLNLLSNDSTCYIRYTKKVTTPTEFDPLFVKLLANELALAMIFPLSKTNAGPAADRIKGELLDLHRKARAVDAQERRLGGHEAKKTWLTARRTGFEARIDRLGCGS